MGIGRKTRISSEILFCVGMLFVGCVVPLVALKSAVTINKIAVFGLEIIAGVGLGLQFLLYLTKFRKRVMSIYFAAAAVVSPVIILLSLKS